MLGLLALAPLNNLLHDLRRQVPRRSSPRSTLTRYWEIPLAFNDPLQVYASQKLLEDPHGHVNDVSQEINTEFLQFPHRLKERGCGLSAPRCARTCAPVS